SSSVPFCSPSATRCSSTGWRAPIRRRENPDGQREAARFSAAIRPRSDTFTKRRVEPYGAGEHPTPSSYTYVQNPSIPPHARRGTDHLRGGGLRERVTGLRVSAKRTESAAAGGRPRPVSAVGAAADRI